MFFSVIITNSNWEILPKSLVTLKDKMVLRMKNFNILVIHKLAMRTKHLLNQKYKENLSLWNHLATYWLAKDIHKFGKEYN